MLWSTILTELLVILALILLNGLLAMSEMAIVSARKTRLQQLASNGHAGAKLALDLANTPSHFLASIQIGITLIGVLAGAFGGATVAEEIAKNLSTVPLLAEYSEPIGLACVVLTVTFLSLILGELVPKRIALSHAEKVAAGVSRPIRFVSIIASPVVKILSFATETVLKLLGVKPNTDPAVSEEEVKIMIAQGTEAGVFEPEEENMLKRVMGIGDRKIGEVMTQRRQLICLDIDAPFQENLNKVLATPHSYFPVYQGTTDVLVGVVSVKCLLDCIAKDAISNIDIRKCLFEPLYVAEGMSTLKLLERFKRSGKHLALVVDEYGGTAGLVTIVDLIEAIVGDLPSEAEQGDTRVVKRDDGSLLIDGMLPTYELVELLGITDVQDDLKGDFQTVGGLVMARLGHIPKEGESFIWRHYRFEVIDMDAHRVDKILISIPS